MIQLSTELLIALGINVAAVAFFLGRQQRLSNQIERLSVQLDRIQQQVITALAELNVRLTRIEERLTRVEITLDVLKRSSEDRLRKLEEAKS